MRLGKRFIAMLCALTLPVLPALAAGPEPDPGMLYNRHCAICHGIGRLGGTGPALLPGNLSRLKLDEAIAVIRDGRPATQMIGYQDLLSSEEIDALAEWIYEP
ncbi:MAG: cytochrome c, partial [Halomonadaceae bacterium]|nr:cytochrome c [Halomonadaceae bacterium]